jgi:hypothetical protein
MAPIQLLIYEVNVASSYLWQQAISNNHQLATTNWIKVTTPSCVSQTWNSHGFFVCINDLEFCKIIPVMKKSALEGPKFWRRGSVLSWKLVDKDIKLAGVTRRCPGHHIEVIKCIMRGKVARKMIDHGSRSQVHPDPDYGPKNMIRPH